MKGRGQIRIKKTTTSKSESSCARTEIDAKITIINIVSEMVENKQYGEVFATAKGDELLAKIDYSEEGGVATRYWKLSAPQPRWPLILSAKPMASEVGVRAPAKKDKDEVVVYELAPQLWRGRNGKLLPSPTKPDGSPVIWLQGGKHEFFHTCKKKPRGDSRIVGKIVMNFSGQTVAVTRFYHGLESCSRFVTDWRGNLARAEFYHIATGELLFFFSKKTMFLDYTEEWARFRSELSRDWRKSYISKK